MGITISKNLTLAGASKETTIIDAQGLSQIFNIEYGYTVLIQDITFKNSKNADSGGAIYSDGTLTVKNRAFQNNTAIDSEGPSAGGAIFTYTTLNVMNSLFTGNTADAWGGPYSTRVEP